MYTNTPKFETANDAWLETLREILYFGNEVNPRGKRTKEILNNSFYFDMNYPVCYHQDRKLSYQFMAAEADWIISGDNTVQGIAGYNKNIAQFSDNGQIFNGAYGPPFQEQLPYIVRSLNQDSTTRQAVMTLWNRRPEPSKDIPCTVSLAWNIRENQLNCHVFMRSSDAWLGLPYDLFNFTMMTCRVGSLIINQQLNLGHMFVTLVSSHLYEEQWAAADDKKHVEPDKLPKPISCQWSEWDQIQYALIICKNNAKDAKLDFWNIRP